MGRRAQTRGKGSQPTRRGGAAGALPAAPGLQQSLHAPLPNFPPLTKAFSAESAPKHTKGSVGPSQIASTKGHSECPFVSPQPPPVHFPLPRLSAPFKAAPGREQPGVPLQVGVVLDPLQRCVRGSQPWTLPLVGGCWTPRRKGQRRSPKRALLQRVVPQQASLPRWSSVSKKPAPNLLLGLSCSVVELRWASRVPHTPPRR